MAKSLLRTDKEIAALYRRHNGTVYRVCFSFLKNPADTEDAVQETFFRLIQSGPVFESEAHEKAWLIRTAGNLCKNVLRHWWRRRESLEDHENIQGGDFKMDEVLAAVLDLPERYKTAIYLYYYEGYDSAEIAKTLEKPQSTIRNYLHEARGILREKLGGDFQ